VRDSLFVTGIYLSRLACIVLSRGHTKKRMICVPLFHLRNFVFRLHSI
jgi:hypothetical protein